MFAHLAERLQSRCPGLLLIVTLSISPLFAALSDLDAQDSRAAGTSVPAQNPPKPKSKEGGVTVASDLAFGQDKTVLTVDPTTRSLTA